MRCSLAQGTEESRIKVGYPRNLVIKDCRAVGDDTVSLAKRTTELPEHAVRGSVGHAFGLVRDLPELRNVWAASLVSAFGLSVRHLALLLTAALLLEAGRVERGLLATADTLPSFLFGLLAGVVFD